MTEKIHYDGNESTGGIEKLTRDDILEWLENNSRIETEGEESLPLRGAVIIAANHDSSLDPFVVEKVIQEKTGRRDLYTLTKKESVEQEETGIILTGSDWLAKCAEVLDGSKDQGMLLVFPQGSLSERLEEKKDIHRGAVVVSKETGIPILPIRIIGTEKYGDSVMVLDFLRNRSKLKEKINLLVKFGSPRLPSSGSLTAESEKLLEDILSL